MSRGAAVAILLLAPAIARADTRSSPWAIAKEPRLGADEALHFAVQQEIGKTDGQRERDRESYYERALALVARRALEPDADVRLVFDHGLCLERLRRHGEAARVLGQALAAAPRHPMALEGPEPAWLTYAFANAYLERSEEERLAYERYLEHATEAPRRLVPMLNQAEAAMRLGDLSAAVGEYRAVLTLAASLPNTAGNAQTSALAKWGLTVALDRSGDLGAAIRSAREAVSMDPPPSPPPPPPGFRPLRPSEARPAPSYSITLENDRIPVILDRRGVFFVPDYERLWYLALGEAALARDSADSAAALFHWRVVERFLERYVTGARAHGDRWLALAEQRLAAARKRRAEVEARVPAARRGALGPDVRVD